MKRWETYLYTTTLAASLMGVPFAWGQQSVPKPAVPSMPASSPAAPTAPAAAPTVGAKVDINSADEATLMVIKGIGKTKAKAIIEYRQKNGPFKSIDDLTKIKGIKGKSLQRFKDQLTIS